MDEPDIVDKVEELQHIAIFGFDGIILRYYFQIFY